MPPCSSPDNPVSSTLPCFAFSPLSRKYSPVITWAYTGPSGGYIPIGTKFCNLFGNIGPVITFCLHRTIRHSLQIWRQKPSLHELVWCYPPVITFHSPEHPVSSSAPHTHFSLSRDISPVLTRAHTGPSGAWFKFWRQKTFFVEFSPVFISVIHRTIRWYQKLTHWIVRWVKTFCTELTLIFCNFS